MFTRTGAHGVRRVRTGGVIAAAFDHWDSRKGDPQLHTHVTIANRVQAPDGEWRTIDSSTLFRAAVAYSETYNQLLADEVTRRTGLGWETRERGRGRNRRTARELAGVPDALIAVFSQRSADIEAAVDTAVERHVAADRAATVHQVVEPDPAASHPRHPGPEEGHQPGRRHQELAATPHRQYSGRTRPIGRAPCTPRTAASRI